MARLTARRRAKSVACLRPRRRDDPPHRFFDNPFHVCNFCQMLHAVAHYRIARPDVTVPIYVCFGKYEISFHNSLCP